MIFNRLTGGVKLIVVGLGDINSHFVVYIQNRPDYSDLLHLEHVRPVNENEIYDIGQQCGNGWRKVFNVYAKLVYALQARMHFSHEYQSWQQWRDQKLLRKGSNSLLLFSRPDLGESNDSKIHIVMGKGWAQQCGLSEKVHWLNQDFAILREHGQNQNLIVCPYFDYRQLSNQKIVFLCDLLSPMLNKDASV